MILISLHCQMGNQMFQYAFARSQAKRLNTVFIPFVSIPYYPYKLHFFETDRITDFIYTNNWRTRQFKRICRKLNKYIFTDKIISDEWNPSIPYKNQGYYEGFFQSDLYFKNYEQIIRKAFRIKKKYRYEFQDKYTDFLRNNKIIVVHVRRTDYHDVEFDGLGGQGVTLPLTYYHKALDLIPNIEKYQVLFISDDMDSIRNDFGDKSNYHYESNSAIVDFQLIQHADIAIIANSTFAWWAAYLSQNNNSRIMAPEYWLGHKTQNTYPAGIRTDRFEWVNFQQCLDKLY